MSPDGPTIGVLGLGLIGGSIARRWADEGSAVVAWSRSASTRAAAAGHPGVVVVDAVAEVVAAADVVVLATPLAVLADTLDVVAEALGDRADGPTVTDVGSVKAPIAAHAAAVLAHPSTFVPGHPMAGTERSGWASADPTLFEGARWALALDEPVDLDRWRAVARVALALGATVVPVDVAAHDGAVAVTSHLPHVIAAALSHQLRGAPAVARSLVGPSFRSAVRVVQGSGRQLGAELAVANAAELVGALATFRAELDDLVGPLSALAAAVDPGAAAAVRASFAAGDLSALIDPPTAPATCGCTRDELAALGRRGGLVVGFDPDGRVRTAEPAEPTQPSGADR